MATREQTAAEQCLEQPYEIALVRREGVDGASWCAQVVEFPGCEAWAGTEEDALAAVRQAMVTWVQEALDNERPVPAPKAAAAHSGRLLVRMPPSLHSGLARLADREKVSLNTLIVGVLSGAIAWRQPGDADSSVARPTKDRAASTDEVLNVSAPVPGDEDRARNRGRLLSVALTANLVIVVVAGLLAIGLMVTLLTA